MATKIGAVRFQALGLTSVRLANQRGKVHGIATTRSGALIEVSGEGISDVLSKITTGAMLVIPVEGNV